MLQPLSLWQLKRDSLTIHKALPLHYACWYLNELSFLEEFPYGVLIINWCKIVGISGKGLTVSPLYSLMPFVRWVFLASQSILQLPLAART